MIRRTGSFTAQDDVGRIYTIFIDTEFHQLHTSEGVSVLEGLKSLITSTGEHLNWLKKGEYQIVGTGQILRSSSPDAF